MLTLAWVVLFLVGIVVIVALWPVVALIRFLFGGSRRPDADYDEDRRSGVFSLIARIAFFLFTITLFVSAAALRLLSTGRTVPGCAVFGAGIECGGYPGAGVIGWWLSLPGSWGDHSNLLLVVLRDLPRHIGEGFANLPISFLDMAQGLIGPALLVLSWLGFISLVRGIGRMWRG